MGFYDRDYYREQRPGFTLRAPQTIVSALILINVAIWAIDGLFMPETHWLSNEMAVHPNTLTQPWLWWQYLTYAFAHEPGWPPFHILFNMLALFFLGYDVEGPTGGRSFCGCTS